MRHPIVVSLIVATLGSAACSSASPASSPGSSSAPATPSAASTHAGSPLDGTWTSATHTVPELVTIIAAHGFQAAQVRSWVLTHLDPAPTYTISLRFVGGQLSQFQGTGDLSSGGYTTSGHSLTWTEADSGCAVTVAFHVSGSTLGFGKISHEGCPTEDAHMAHALFFGEPYDRTG